MQKHRALKSEIDPHFFFNSLSVLSSLVYSDPKQAVKYISQLSKVYRNYFDKTVESLVLLRKELSLLDAYMYLLSIRFGKNIRFETDVPERARNIFYIPPNSLQLLIENAIKHNKCASDEVLTISISLEDQYIVVKNNLNLRTDHDGGSGLGLENIRSRFQLLKEKEIVVESTDEFFLVKLPYYTLAEYEGINI